MLKSMFSFDVRVACCSRVQAVAKVLQQAGGWKPPRICPCHFVLRLGFLSLLCLSASACSLILKSEADLDANPPDLAADFTLSSATPPGEVRASLDFREVLRHKLPDPPLQVTREVKRELRNLLKGNAQCIRVAYDRREEHLSAIAQIFRDEGMPHDLMNLAVIESRFSTDAMSRSGALGIWQFTRGTAKLYGLRIEGGLDQRKDPILSTLAASRLLRDLYDRYSDWYLALAAYNAGPGVVDRAVAKSANDSFWALARGSYFSKQTKDFVPRFIAATIIMKTAEKYGMNNLAQRVSAHLAEHGVPLDLETTGPQGAEPYADRRSSFFG